MNPYRDLLSQTIDNYTAIDYTNDLIEISGDDAVRLWIERALATQRLAYKIYSDDYGQELENLIGQMYSKEHTIAETQKLLDEALLIHPLIKNIIIDDIEFGDDNLSLKITVDIIHSTSNRTDIFSSIVIETIIPLIFYADVEDEHGIDGLKAIISDVNANSIDDYIFDVDEDIQD